MAVPGFPAAAQSADSGARIQGSSPQGRKALKQGEASSGKQGVDSFLQFLQGAVKDAKGGASEAERDEQAQASASLRLLALLFQLDPAQLKNLAGEASQMTGSEGNAESSGEGGRLLAILQGQGGNGQGLEALSRLLTPEGPSQNSDLLADLRETLVRMQGSGNWEKSVGQAGEALQGILNQTEGQGPGKAGAGGRAERILQLVLSGESRENGSSKGGDVGQFVSALRNALEQGRLSREQLQAFARDLSSMTSENTSQPKSAAQTIGPGGLAALLQQAEASEGQRARPGASREQGNAAKGRSGVDLARLFLESFDRSEHSGRNKGVDGSSAKGGQSSPQQGNSLLQSLVKQGQHGTQKPDISPAQSSAGKEGSNPGVSTKAGEWGTLLSSIRGAGSGSVPGSVARASQPAGSSSMMDNQVLQQVVSKFQTELQRGSRRVNIRMHPPELGRVQLKLTSEDSTMQVQLQVQNSQVQGILERNMPALRQALEQQNLDFDSIQVSVESGQQEGSTGYSRQSESEFPSRMGWTGSGDAEAEDQGAGIPAARSGESGGLSLRV